MWSLRLNTVLKTISLRVDVNHCINHKLLISVFFNLRQSQIKLNCYLQTDKSESLHLCNFNFSDQFDRKQILLLGRGARPSLRHRKFFQIKWYSFPVQTGLVENLWMDFLKLDWTNQEDWVIGEFIFFLQI